MFKRAWHTNLKICLASGYRVGDPICPACVDELGEDNLSENTEPRPESLISVPEELNITNFPNPFNPTTKIYCNLPIEGIAKITIYNSAGQKWNYCWMNLNI